VIRVIVQISEEHPIVFLPVGKFCRHVVSLGDWRAVVWYFFEQHHQAARGVTPAKAAQKCTLRHGSFTREFFMFRMRGARSNCRKHHRSQCPDAFSRPPPPECLAHRPGICSDRGDAIPDPPSLSSPARARFPRSARLTQGTAI
jgi:hypothetical protein